MKITPTISAAILIAVLGLTTGCSTLTDSQRETVRNAAKEIALIGIGIGLNQLGDSVHELRPYIPTLQASINATFAATDDPQEAATATAAAVNDIIPTEYREDVIAEIIRSASSPATASGDSVGDFGSRYSSALMQR